MGHVGNDGSEVVQPVHCLDMKDRLWGEIPCGAEIRGQFAWRE